MIEWRLKGVGNVFEPDWVRYAETCLNFSLQWFSKLCIRGKRQVFIRDNANLDAGRIAWDNPVDVAEYSVRC